MSMGPTVTPDFKNNTAIFSTMARMMTGPFVMGLALALVLGTMFGLITF